MKGVQLRSALIAAFYIFAVVARQHEEKKSRYLRQVVDTANHENNTARLNKRKLHGEGSSSKSASKGKGSSSSKSKGSSSKSGGKGSKSSKSPNSSKSPKSSKSPGSGKGSKSKSSSGPGSSKSSKGSSSKSKSSSKSSSKSGSSSKDGTMSPTMSPNVSLTSNPVIPPTAAPAESTPVPSPTPSSLLTESPTGLRVCNNISREQRDDEVEAIIRSITDDGVLDNADSPQSKAMNWLLFEDSSLVCPGARSKVIQRYALTVFYYSTGGDEWTFCSNDERVPCTSNEARFLSTSDECGWYGVSCNELERVNVLKLEPLSGADIGLKGTIPPEIFSMPRLKDLELEFNTLDPRQRGQLEGPIPEAIFEAKSIRALDLQRQRISGEIPSAFYETPLREVDLDNNALTGSITDVEKMTNLVFFTASNNPFDKQNLPAGFGEISGLKFLGLNNANLIGPIPESFNQLVNMRSIDLSDNEMTGDISFLEDFTELNTVALDNNMFNGDIPEGLWTQSQMTIINLESNGFTGQISDTLGQMSMLTTLRLADNNLTGPLPASLKELTRLRLLTLEGNNFDEGSSIPAELCREGVVITIPRQGVECPVNCCQVK